MTDLRGQGACKNPPYPRVLAFLQSNPRPHPPSRAAGVGLRVWNQAFGIQHSPAARKHA